VRKYLRQFLNDPFVIDINPVARFFLVNFLIIPFRAVRSAKLYKQIWTKDGSPLLVHSLKQKELLQQLLDQTATSSFSTGDKYIVEVGMRYQNPSIESSFIKLVERNVESIVAIPLYPQWASSSTQSSVVEIKRVAKKIGFMNLKIIEKFYDDEKYIDALVSIAKKYNPNEYDFFLFSYHGLPERQITNIYPAHCRINDTCCSTISEKNKFCYRAACYYTTQQLVKRLNIPEGKYIISFQSRLNDKWLKPYTDKIIVEKARQGVRKILVFSPSFVADCLETIQEIGIEYEKLFRNNGGEKLDLVECLNENKKWIECLKEIVIGNQYSQLSRC
jgi:ferrochelatase